MKRALLCLVLSAGAARAQSTVVLRSAGPGEPGRLLGAALAAPHQLVVARDSAAALPRDTTFDRTVIVLAPRATVASSVRGDVIVVGGDLFLHPGASIEGRAIAIGGGVYNSTLAKVRGGLIEYRDVTFEVSEVSGRLHLVYRSLVVDASARRFSLPLVYGVRIPNYTRVDGLAATWGPRFSLRGGAVWLEPLATYRSDLGAVDPSLYAQARLSESMFVEASAARGTFSNDRWIRSDPLNALVTLFSGQDVRNYFRADRMEARVHRGWRTATAELSASLGGRTERAWSVAAGTPWSLFGRKDVEDGILRPNPSVRHGRVSSALAGAGAAWQLRDVKVSVGAEAELGMDAPGGEFTQTTADVRVEFPTFRNQRFALESHIVISASDSVPPQRFAYLGGSGTLPTLALLSMGGDRLLFVESRYIVPLEAVRLPAPLGPPVIMLRHMIGAAGLGEVPDLEQNVGLRLQLAVVKADFTLNPANGDQKISVGLALR